MNNYFLLLCMIVSSVGYAGTNDKPQITKDVKDKCLDFKGHQPQIEAPGYDTDSCYGALSITTPEYSQKESKSYDEIFLEYLAATTPIDREVIEELKKLCKNKQ